MDTTPGFYGKFPELGDFVNRRLPKEFLDSWDDWLQGAIASSREQLGENWLNVYLTSPIWRFVLSRGLCGEYPWFGLMMPSVDRVGRYFPLTLACRLPLDANLLRVTTDGAGWFEMGEEVILGALEAQDFNMEEFDARVVSLGTMDELADTLGARIDTGYGSAWQVPLDAQGIAGGITLLAHQLLLQRLGDYSLWWGHGSEKITPSLLLCGGMPDATDFAAMLSGEWSSGSWEQWPTISP